MNMQFIPTSYHFLYLVNIAKTVFTLFVLGFFSILDIKYRDIPAVYVWISLGIAILLASISFYIYVILYSASLLIIYFIISLLVGFVLLYILYIMGFLGEADVFIGFELAILYPTPDVYDLVLFKAPIGIRMPPVIPIMIYSNILVAVLIPLLVIANLRHKELYTKYNVSFTKKILLLITSKPVKIKDYLNMKHVYPLEIIKEEEGRLVRSIRTTFDINEDYRVHQETIKSLVEKGLLKDSDYIIITYGIPYILPILLGFILFLTIGETPIVLLIKAFT